MNPCRVRAAEAHPTGNQMTNITESDDRMSETTGTQWPDRATSSAACHPKSRDARFCDSGTHDFHGRVAAHV